MEEIYQKILEQGILGAMLLLLFLMFKRFIEKLFKVVENNTEAMTASTEQLKSMQHIIQRCDRRKEA